MPPAAAQAGRALAFVALGSFPLLYHAALATGRWTPSAAGLAFVQLLVISLLLMARSTYRRKWYVGASAACFLAIICWRSAQVSVVAASAIPHTLAYVALLAVFGSTLLPGREPLITALTRSMRGVISDRIVAYTRRVTVVWCSFFAAQLVVSLVLFVSTPLSVWSFFVNVLNLPLLVLMFGVEYGYRILRVQGAPRHNLSDVPVIVAYLKQRLLKPANSSSP
jgi:uncharacterized membrane protein